MKNRKYLFYVTAAASLVLTQGVRADVGSEPGSKSGPVLLAQNTGTPAKPGPAGVAAEVNGEKIMLADVDRAVNKVKESDPALQDGSEEAKKVLAGIRDQHLEDLITHALLSQEAKRRNIAPKAGEVDKAFKDLKGETPDAEFNAALAKDGKSVADLRKFLAEEISIRELTARITAPALVKEEDVVKFYNENPDRFMLPETAKASHIFFAFTANMADADKAALKAQALDVLNQVKAKPATFGDLAKKYSQDPDTKDVGGSFGDEFFHAQMIKELADVIFAKPANTLVPDIVESPFGYHIIRIDERSPQSKVPLDEVRDELKGYLLVPKKKSLLDEQIKALRAKANIKKYA